MRLRTTMAFFVVGFAIAVLLTGGKASLSPKPAARPSRGPDATLTRDTLPISVGTTWTIAHQSGNGLPIDIKVAGPWTITADTGWRQDHHEIVDPKTVPDIERFSNVTFVDKGADQGATVYYVRRVADKWVDHLGTITVRGDKVDPKPLATPSHFWPLDFRVGGTYLVSDNASGRIEAKVLARSTADVPAGRIDNAYLVRFTYAPTDSAQKPTIYYYVFAPNVGFVALFRPTAGDEKTGFTAADQVDVLWTAPR